MALSMSSSSEEMLTDSSCPAPPQRAPPKPPKAKKAKPPPAKKLPASEILGQTVSTSLMSCVNASQGDISSVMRNLGFRPIVNHREVLSDSDSGRSSSSDGSLFPPEEKSRDRSRSPHKSSKSRHGCSYNLRDFSALDTLEILLMRYGRAGHMGCRDHSYSFFLNDQRDGALYYKVLNKIAVVSGDPLCCPTRYVSLLEEFRAFCKHRHWGVAMIGASDDMAAIAKQQKHWVTMGFGTEKVINPMTNPLLLGTGGKRTVTKCNQLLKAGLTVELYCPSYQYDPTIENEIVRIYEEWRTNRNDERGDCQAFITVFDILALPRLMAYVYTKDAQGTINGFAALRRLGNGFHIDPFISSADAPRGTTDLLLFASMALCRDAGISNLTLGFEPLSELGEVSGLGKTMTDLTRKVHNKIFGQLPLSGKKTFYQRFYPDEEQESGLHIIFLSVPGPKHMLAMVHFANISLRGVVRDCMAAKTECKDKEVEAKACSDDSGKSSEESS